MDPQSSDFWFDPPETLYEALRRAPSAEDLVLRLLRAISAAEVSVIRNESGERTFLLNSNPGYRGIELTLSDDGEVSGSDLELIEKTYRVVHAIETELDAAVYVPPELRKKRVSSVLTRLGVSKGEFDRVVRNWTKF